MEKNALNCKCADFKSSTRVTAYIYVCFFLNLVLVAEHHVDR